MRRRILAVCLCVSHPVQIPKGGIVGQTLFAVDLLTVAVNLEIKERSVINLGRDQLSIILEDMCQCTLSPYFNDVMYCLHTVLS